MLRKILSKIFPMMVTTTSLGGTKSLFLNFLPKILLSNPRNLGHLLLGLNHPLERLIPNVLNVWVKVT